MIPFLSDPDFTLYQGDVLETLRELPAESVNCVVTSPPYWGLRDYSVDGQLGLEPTPEEYIARMVEVFREVRRVLRRDGTCWLNIGDSYATQRNDNGWPENPGATAIKGNRVPAGLKQKDLCGVPWRLAFALQADGWYLRADVIWSKPNPMPESVTDRPTKAHEYVFLLTKSARYWFDQEAVREPAEYGRREWKGDVHAVVGLNGAKGSSTVGGRGDDPSAGRNIRSVWEIATQPYPEAHFATYPEELVRRCVLAGCPEWVCGTCGKPRERITDGATYYRDRDTSKPLQKYAQVGQGHGGVGRGPKSNLGESIAQTVGFTDCGHDNYQPGTVLDPFCGSGTTAVVARKHNRRCIGIELNASYCELAARRTQQLTLEATA